MPTFPVSTGQPGASPRRPAEPRDAGTWAANEALVGELAQRMPPATVAAVMRDANRVTRTLGSHPHRWGVAPEDLLYSPLSTRIYSLTEHPGKRVVFAVPAGALP